MERLSKEERRERTMRAAQKELAKSGNLQIRIEEAILARVYELANRKGIRYTTMVRDWIVEKLDQENTPATKKDPVTTDVIAYLMQNMIEINQRLHSLETEVRSAAKQNKWGAGASLPIAAEPPSAIYDPAQSGLKGLGEVKETLGDRGNRTRNIQTKAKLPTKRRK